ncbi:MAG: hypothetical protein O3B72_02390 [Proteobacteria bacterium]|nr:hypothetical protein [Pseudomonadota bacterium]
MALSDWVAKPGEEPTEVIEPIYIQRNAIQELLFYHPTTPSNGACRLKLVDKGGQGAVEVVGRNWNSQWHKQLEALRFDVVNGPDGEYLEDANIQPFKFGASEWQVTRWQIVETVNASSQKIFQELIDWKDREGRISFSTYAWLPY